MRAYAALAAMAGDWAMALLEALGGDEEEEPRKQTAQEVYEAQVAVAQAQAAAAMQMQAHAALRESSDTQQEARQAHIEAQMQALQQAQSLRQGLTNPQGGLPPEPIQAPLQTIVSHSATAGAGPAASSWSAAPPASPAGGWVDYSKTSQGDPGDSSGWKSSGWIDNSGAASSSAGRRDDHEKSGKAHGKGKAIAQAPADAPISSPAMTQLWQAQLQQAQAQLANPQALLMGSLDSLNPANKRPVASPEPAPKPAPKQQRPVAEDPEKHRCPLHKKANGACKFCKKYVEAKKEAEAALNWRPSDEREMSTKMVFNCSPLLKNQLLNSSYYKSLLTISSIPEFVSEIQQYATDTMDVYKSAMEPSCFMCCAYRLYTLALPEEDLRRITDNQESPLVRCVAFLFIRYAAPAEDLWDKLEEFILDDEPIFVKDGSQGYKISIGQYIEDLLLKDKYLSTPLPRIPNAARRKLEERLAPMTQYRKRSKANKKIFGRGLFKFNMEVEACVGGVWYAGRATELLNRMKSRFKLRVQLENGEEHVVHIGKVILSPSTVVPPAREQSRSRSRSNSPDADPNEPDWSRWKGKSDASTVEELRARAREDAVCSSGKDYAKRLPRYEQTLAIRREQGSQEARLIEEETYINMNAPKHPRSAADSWPKEELDEFALRQKRPRTDEDDDRQKKLKDIFEKYGQQKAVDKNVNVNDVEGPDTLRLG